MLYYPDPCTASRGREGATALTWFYVSTWVWRVSRLREDLSHTSTHQALWHGALSRCPGVIVFHLYFSLPVVYEQSQRIRPIRDVLQCDFCMLGKMSGVDVTEVKRRTL